MLGPDSNESFW